MGIKLRAIIIADIEVKTLNAAAEHEKKLRELAREIEKWGPPDACWGDEDFGVEKVQAMIPMQERRGETGPIDAIVFRGSRGSNSPVRIPSNISAGVKKRLQFARHTMIQKGMHKEDIEDQLEREAEHLMEQYGRNVRPLQYSRDMETIFDND